MLNKATSAQEKHIQAGTKQMDLIYNLMETFWIVLIQIASVPLPKSSKLPKWLESDKWIIRHLNLNTCDGIIQLSSI